MLEVHRPGYKVIVFTADETSLHPQNGNVDVEVQFDSGERYGATLFTLNSIAQLMRRDEQSGEANYGSFFGCPDMIVVRTLTLAAITENVEWMIAHNELKQLFQPLLDE